MPTFVFTYRTTRPASGDAGPTPEALEAWRSWFAGIGDHVAEMGKPVFESTSVGATDSSSTSLGGYSVISADDLEAAVTLAKGCPVLGYGGGVEIGQLGDM